MKAAALGIDRPPGLPQNGDDGKPQTQKKYPCKYWMTERGCTRGDSCKFHHAQLDPKSGICFNCSGVGHLRTDCPIKKGIGTPKMIPQKRLPRPPKVRVRGPPKRERVLVSMKALKKPQMLPQRQMCLLDVKRQNVRMGVRMVGTLKMCRGSSLMLPPC